MSYLKTYLDIWSDVKSFINYHEKLSKSQSSDIYHSSIYF